MQPRGGTIDGVRTAMVRQFATIPAWMAPTSARNYLELSPVRGRRRWFPYPLDRSAHVDISSLIHSSKEDLLDTEQSTRTYTAGNDQLISIPPLSLMTANVGSGMASSVRLVAVESVGEDAVALTIDAPPGFEAAPGQFIKLTASVSGEELSRFYSISSPTVDETFEITIEVDPDGTLAPWLADREAGDTLTIAGPFGNTFYEGETYPVILAGGPGVGPAVGIAERAVEEGHRAAIVYQDDAPIHADRLTALENRGVFVAVLDSEESIVDAVEGCLTADAQVFIYGFADFLDGAMDAISAAGGEPDRAKIENFG